MVLMNQASFQGQDAVVGKTPGKTGLLPDWPAQRLTAKNPRGTTGRAKCPLSQAERLLEIFVEKAKDALKIEGDLGFAEIGVHNSKQHLNGGLRLGI